MEDLELERDSTAYSFKQLIKLKKNQYLNETDFDAKQEIALKFICDPEVSSDLLDKCIDEFEKANEDPNSIYNSIDSIFSCLKYSLTKAKNLKYYSYMKNLEPNLVDSVYKYLAFNDPINNFKSIYSQYFLLLSEIKDKAKIKENLGKIDKYIDDMLLVYNIDLENYYYPPMEEYPIYAYNFYSFLFYKILKKFREKKIFNPFQTDKTEKTQYINNEKERMYYLIGLFFQDVNKIFLKFNYENIQKDIKTLKIISFYLKILEYCRDYNTFRDIFQKIINCIDSEPITSDILKRFEFFRKNGKTPLTEKDWNSIKLNEILYIDNNPLNPVKIKHFRKDILNLEDIPLFNALMSHSIDYLNIDGLIQNSIIKYDDKIEEYSKKLLKNIFSSDMYRNNFLFHDKRFGSKDAKKAIILEDIFKGKNKDIIFEEIWNNIFFLPFPNQDLSGFNNRPQYAMFINSIPEINRNQSFQKIIPRFHCDINTLFHEFTHNIAILLAANLEEEEFETSIKNDNDDLNNLQKKYSLKYNQNNIIYNKFDDFGDLMEVKMYGIRPRKFKTFSGLFCLNCNSYSLNPDDFRELCVGLYNMEIENTKDDSEKSKISDKNDLNNKLKDLMNSEIAQLLQGYFFIDKGLKNESYTESGKPRENANFMYNEEFSVNTDYCDKLDKI